MGTGVTLSPWSPRSISSGASLSFANESEEAWAPGLQFEAAVFLGGSVAVGAEFAWPLRRTIQQGYSYFGFGYQAEIRYRELPMFATMRVQPGGRASPLALVVGGGPVRQDGFERQAPALRGGGYAPFGPEAQTIRWTWGGMAGVDWSVPVGRRLSLVPQLRAVVVERGDTAEADAFADLGFPPVTLRAAVTLRLRN